MRVRSRHTRQTRVRIHRRPFHPIDDLDRRRRPTTSNDRSTHASIDASRDSDDRVRRRAMMRDARARGDARGVDECDAIDVDRSTSIDRRDRSIATVAAWWWWSTDRPTDRSIDVVRRRRRSRHRERGLS